MKKVFAFLLAALMAAGAMAGCSTGGETASSGGEAASAAESAAEESAGGETTPAASGKITVFQQKTEIYDQLLEMAKDYQAETGVEVEVWKIAGDDYYSNLKTYLSSESGPTVFSLSSATEIEELGLYLEDLGGLSVVPKIQEDLLGVYEGTTIGIPMTAEGFGLIYNKDMVDPSAITDTASLVSFIQENAANEVTGLGLSQEDFFLIGQILNVPFAMQDDPAGFCQQVYSGEVRLADVPEFQEFAQVFAAIREYQQNPLEVTYDNNCGNFATGKAATIHQGNWAYSVLANFSPEFEMGIMPLPICGNDKISVGVPSVWCVNTDASDEEKQLGKDFIDWMYTSETGTRYLMEEFHFIPVVDGMESPELDPLSASVAEAISSGSILPWTFNIEWPAGIIMTNLSPVAQEFFTSDMSEEDFLNALNEAFVTAANE